MRLRSSENRLLLCVLLLLLAGIATGMGLQPSDREVLERYLREGHVGTESDAQTLEKFFARRMRKEFPEGSYVINQPPITGKLAFYILKKDPERRFGHQPFNAAYHAELDAIFVDQELVQLARYIDSPPPILVFILLHELGHRTQHSGKRNRFDFWPLEEASQGSYAEEEAADDYALDAYIRRRWDADDPLYPVISELVGSLSLYLADNGPYSALERSRSHPQLFTRLQRLYAQAMIREPHDEDLAEQARMLRNLHSTLSKHLVASINLPPGRSLESAVRCRDSLFLLANGQLFTLPLRVVERNPNEMPRELWLYPRHSRWSGVRGKLECVEGVVFVFGEDGSVYRDDGGERPVRLEGVKHQGIVSNAGQLSDGGHFRLARVTMQGELEIFESDLNNGQTQKLAAFSIRSLGDFPFPSVSMVIFREHEAIVLVYPGDGTLRGLAFDYRTQVLRERFKQPVGQSVVVDPLRESLWVASDARVQVGDLITRVDLDSGRAHKVLAQSREHGSAKSCENPDHLLMFNSRGLSVVDSELGVVCLQDDYLISGILDAQRGWLLAPLGPRRTVLVLDVH